MSHYVAAFRCGAMASMCVHEHPTYSEARACADKKKVELESAGALTLGWWTEVLHLQSPEELLALVAKIPPSKKKGKGK